LNSRARVPHANFNIGAVRCDSSAWMQFCVYTSSRKRDLHISRTRFIRKRSKQSLSSLPYTWNFLSIIVSYFIIYSDCACKVNKISVTNFACNISHILLVKNKRACAMFHHKSLKALIAHFIGGTFWRTLGHRNSLWMFFGDLCY